MAVTDKGLRLYHQLSLREGKRSSRCFEQERETEAILPLDCDLL